MTFSHGRETAFLLQGIPAFSTFTPPQCDELALLMQEVNFNPQDIIVMENEVVDSIFIVLKGEAEVSHVIRKHDKLVQVPIAVLRRGESIGLSDTGFYSTSGMRTATVSALTPLLALRLDIKDFYHFLKKHHLEHSMYEATNKILRMQLIKQSLPFTKLSNDRLIWLVNHIEEAYVPAGKVIFEQGEIGNKCYLIQSGKVEILIKDAQGVENRVAMLSAPALFGEATLITHQPRNATARAFDNVQLLTLSYQYLSELIESEKNVAQTFMDLIVDRSRPLQNPNVAVHYRKTADGEKLTILKQLENRIYFQLSNAGTYIWKKLDGHHTLEDITLDFADHFKIFAPDMVAALISKLAHAGFIANLTMLEEHLLPVKRSRQLMTKIKALAEIRVSIKDVNPWMTKMYKDYIHYLFSKPAQLIFLIIIVVGMAKFIVSTPNILHFFNIHHASLFLVFVLLPFSLAELILHELGHAFAVKAYGRDVHYMGVGWYWLMPIAFTDTSDMWLSSRKPRMVVNLAGIYVDVLAAGICAFSMFFINNLFWQSILWLFAFYTYIAAFRRLSPLQELDGYYILMDWVEKNHLRQSSVKWLIKDFSKAIFHPRLFLQYRAEVTYWLICLLYLFLLGALILMIQSFVLIIFGVKLTNPYVALAIPIVIAVLSSFSLFYK